MDKKLKKILPLVSKPGRYAGEEVNSIKKDLDKVSLKVALAFPDLYEIGISNLGLQILYHVLNSLDHIAAERVYAPWDDMEKLLRENELPLTSLESALPLSTFNIIGFSLQHELCYTNLLNILDLGGISLRSSERNKEDPLIIAGGPSAFNPEPLSEFVDAFLIGDGEEGVKDICKAYLKWKEAGKTRKELLESLSQIKGVYVPSLFQVSYNESGPIKKITPLKEGYKRVERRVLIDIEEAPYPTGFIIPNVKPVHDRVPLEVARGCSRFCHFCQAGYIYLPVRERSPEKIRSMGEKALAETGNDEAALLSLSTGDYSCLETLLPDLAKRYSEKNVNLSFPSLRVDTITPAIMNEMKKMRAKSFTIAPEAGSQRMRDLINKGVTEEQVLQTARKMSGAGCQSVKLYYMIGLPTETLDDLNEILRLSREVLKEGRKAGSMRKVTVNLSTFVPKSHTPFQWVRQNSTDEIMEKLDYMKKNLKDKNISLKWNDPFMTLLEGIFSRGDRRTGKTIMKAFEKGCRFDSWGDRLRPENWKEAIKESGIEVSNYLESKALDDILPWDLIDPGVTKKFLIDELNRSYEGELTEDCRYGRCSVCGVCDHKILKIRTFKEATLPAQPVKKSSTSSPLKTKFRVRYTKRGPARFMGHTDMIQVLIRTLRRAGIPILYSEGFRPSPKISFGSPIPFATESLAEYFDIEVAGNMTAGYFLDKIAAHAPGYCKMMDAFVIYSGEKSITNATESEVYVITPGEKGSSLQKIREAIHNFESADKWPFIKKTKKGEKEIDLKKEVRGIHIDKEGKVEIEVIATGGRKVKAEDALANLLALTDNEKIELEIIKTDTRFIAHREEARAAKG
ncbi:MAG: TIGR03960 family B12-binding radical SAM protein [Deltaproteobacteria bacterium]|nr:TIGR03960 family B12-binding radical SAM protein [Deltaproteobacteria bacterium]